MKSRKYHTTRVLSGLRDILENHQPLVTEEQLGESRSTPGENGNVGVVSPNLVNTVTSTSPDLIWPSKLQIRRKQLFPEGAIHPH